ncbi:spermidine/putrescine ABC transporter ATP-binding protein [Anaerostipes sp. 494a]|uniref:ABC transporter ATP-binding protein n=1 Tax=Anaerostipes sp. 494a TaxID=1261636 RepID=UPI0009515D1A|nr:ABC transporter ATP-binding protein [Anaerostipes sp. 494a]MDY2725347.1 ABC transporter ATP-binding protein [Anaerostipes faecalis]OLR59702.1 spermidine/putrescine ABC transporter ATP-binding protein [Anaerostipes sp. 494a]
MKDKIIVSLENVEKWYGDNHVVKNMNMEIAEGEFLTLLGPSGCGKTTTLRMISGFESQTSGSIKVEGESVEKKEPYQRDVNTVFQNYALFPNMNVFDNVAYGLKVKKVPKAEIKERVDEMLKLVELDGFGKRRIDQMSGGQKQRVAIARALINRPKVLLLDEPLGALDLKLRKQMQIELKRLQKKLNITFVYVTHDQEEALTMSDRIAIINQGVLEQIDEPRKIYEKPKTKFVAGFIGESNILDVVALEDMGDGVLKVGSEAGNGLVKTENYKSGDTFSISVRPEHMMFSKEPMEGFSLRGIVKDTIYVGNLIKMMVQLNNGDEIKINRFNAEDLAEIGDKVYLYWHLNKCVAVENQSRSIVDTDTVRDLGGDWNEAEK